MDRANYVSILNNDDNPSFTVRSSTRRPTLTRHHSSSSYTSHHSQSQQQQQRPPSDYHPFDPVRGTSPGGSSVGSHDYAASCCGSYFQPTPSESSHHAYVPSTTSASTSFENNTRRTSPAEPPSPPTPSSSSASASASASTSLSRDSSGASNRGVRKNKYPCPYASSHSCPATFTTSGHAARHGKKHTGEKSVHCPICNKAFTRKDNMKQHIRTHRTNSEEGNTGAENTTGAAMGPSSAYYHHHRQHSRSISQLREGGSGLLNVGARMRHAPY